jgi:hypothetical protein
MSSLVTDSRGNRIVVGLVPALYDRVTVDYPDSVTEVYTFYYSGAQQGIVTLTYNGSDQLIEAERTA